MKLSVFRGTGNEVNHREGSWEDLLSDLFPHRAIEIKDQALSFSLTEYRQGGKRRQSDAVASHGICLDFDHLTHAQAVDLITKASEYRCALYTTHRHGLNGEIRLRMVLPFSTPVSPSEHKRIYESWGNHFGATWDDQCSGIQALFFVPTHPPIPLAQPSYQVFNGRLANPREHSAITPSRDMVTNIAVGLVRSRDPAKRALGIALKGVIRGEAYAIEGERNNTAFALVQELARTFPNADAHKMAIFFGPSHQLMGPGVPNIADMWQRVTRSSDKPLDMTLRQSHIAWVFKSERTDFYSKDEWQNISNGGLNPPVLEWRGKYLFLTPKGYTDPQDRDTALYFYRQYLSPINFIKLEEPDGKAVPFSSVLHEYGRTAQSFAYSYTAERTVYNNIADTIIQPCARIRPLPPALNAAVDRWLRIMFRDDDYTTVIRWLVHLTDLNYALAALFVTGAPGTGKSLLAHGLGRLWHEAGPVRLDSVLLGNFNADLLRNPLVFADEGIPKDPRGGNVVPMLRDFISRSIQPYRQKYHPDSYIQGHNRLIITDNSTRTLKVPHDQTRDDVDAISERFLHVIAHAEAAAYLRDVADYIPGWIASDAIARHVLALPAVAREGRFGIRPTRSIAEDMFFTSGSHGRFLEWVVRYLRKPTPIGGHRPIRGGQFYLTPMHVLQIVRDYTNLDHFRNERGLTTEIQAAAELAMIGDPVEGGFYRIKKHAILLVAKYLGTPAGDIDMALAGGRLNAN